MHKHLQHVAPWLIVTLRLQPDLLNQLSCRHLCYFGPMGCQLPLLEGLLARIHGYAGVERLTKVQWMSDASGEA